jgi:rare lipoprotein A (peptidoglycan hydrolase)
VTQTATIQNIKERERHKISLFVLNFLSKNDIKRMKRILAILILVSLSTLHGIAIGEAMSFELEKVDKVNRESKIQKIQKAKKIAELPKHNATWYKTEGTRVHRRYPTAAYNFAPKGTRILVTRIDNKKECVVVVTDRMEYKGANHIDLSHSAFGYLSKHSKGTIKVIVKILGKKRNSKESK